MSKKDNVNNEILNLERDLLAKEPLDSLFKQNLRQDLMEYYNEPIAQPGLFDNLFQQKGMLLAGIAALVLVGGIIGFALISQSQQNGDGGNIATSSSSTNTTSPDSFPVDKPEPEECNTETYTNKKLPGFSFDYEDCEWELRAIEGNRSLEIEMAEVDGNGKLIMSMDFVRLTQLEGNSECASGSFAMVADPTESGIARIKQNSKFFYLSSVHPSGSDTFREIVDAMSEVDADDVDYCYAADLPFVTGTNLDTQGGKLAATFDIEYTGNNANLADPVVDSINFGDFDIITSTTSSASSTSQNSCNQRIDLGSNFRNLIVDANLCQWQKTDQQDSLNLTLTHSSGELNFTFSDTFDGTIECYDYEYKELQGKYLRYKAPNGDGGSIWRYFPSFAYSVAGDSDFESFSDNAQGPTTNVDFCVDSAGATTVGRDNNEWLLDIYFAGENPRQADTIVLSLDLQ